MKNHRFQIAREAGTLISGNVVAQAIALVAYLILTRLYSPNDHGIFNIFYSYIEVLIILSTCKYELALVVADSDREAAALSRFTLKMNAVVSVALLVVITLLYLLNALPGDTKQLGLIALLVPLMVFFCGTTRIYSAMLNRFHGYKQIAQSEVITSAAGVGSKILMGLLGALHAVGLPLGTIIGKMVGNIAYKRQAQRLPLPADITRSEQRAAALKHSNFPRYVMPKDLLNSLSANLPFLWLALYFNKEEVGLFSLALTFTFRPVNLLNVAFEKVLYARIAEKVHAKASIRKEIWHFIVIVGIGALPLFVVAYLFAEPLFTFFFGGRWEGCGSYVRCLLPWVYVMLISTSLMFVSNIFATQRTEFLFYLALLLLRIVALGYGIHQGDFQLAIMLYATAGTIVVLSLLVWYLWQVERYEHNRGQ